MKALIWCQNRNLCRTQKVTLKFHHLVQSQHSQIRAFKNSKPSLSCVNSKVKFEFTTPSKNRDQFSSSYKLRNNTCKSPSYSSPVSRRKSRNTANHSRSQKVVSGINTYNNGSFVGSRSKKNKDIKVNKNLNRNLPLYDSFTNEHDQMDYYSPQKIQENIQLEQQVDHVNLSSHILINSTR